MPVRRDADPVRDCDAGVWHVFVPGVGPARPMAVTGTVTFGPEVLGYSGSVQEVPNEADSAPCVPRSVVVADELFGWRDGARRGYTYAETIIYEVHVDGYRFDLAPTLARQEGEFGTRSAFFDLVARDPVWWARAP